MSNKLSHDNGVRRAAIIMASLGTELASEVCSRMSEDAVRAIANELAHIEATSGKERREILEEFASGCTDIQPVGGLKIAQELLSNTLGNESSRDLLLAHDDGLDRLRYLAEMDAPVIARRLEGELAQTAAVIISQLAASKAAAVLQEMPDERRQDVLTRAATMRSLAPGALQAVAHGLGEMFAPSSVGKQSSTDASLSFMIDLLCNLDQSSEETLLEQLEDVDPDLAQQIRENLFTFDDVLNLSDRALQTVLRAVDDRVLAMALKGLDAEPLERIRGNLSERATEALDEELEAMGPVRVSDVEEARATIATQTRELAEAGDITIDYGDVEYIE